MHAYRAGNERLVWMVSSAPLTCHSDDEGIQKLCYERNNKWMKEFSNVAHNDASALFAFGAAHLYGKQGLIGNLKREGWNVERYPLAWPKLADVTDLPQPPHFPYNIPKSDPMRDLEVFGYFWKSLCKPAKS